MDKNDNGQGVPDDAANTTVHSDDVDGAGALSHLPLFGDLVRCVLRQSIPV